MAMSRKSTIVRFITGSLRVLDLIAPSLAARWGRRLFFTPGRRRAAPHERHVLEQARRFELECTGRKLVGYSWGAGRPVLLVHGWGGQSGQFAELVPVLLDQGFRVVAIDFPAHGSSPGTRSNVFEFRAALLELARRQGPFHAIIGHSLGAMAAALALRSGLTTDKVVLVSPMTSFTFAVNTFARELALSREQKARATAEIAETFKGHEAELELVRLVDEMQAALLVIHDEDDRRVPAQLGRDLVARWPRASYLETQGLGHKRILSAPEVMGEIARFLAPGEPSALPLPSPSKLGTSEVHDLPVEQVAS